MKAVRIIVTIAVSLAAAGSIYFLCIPPLKCAIQEHRVERSTVDLAATEAGAMVPDRARANLASILPCIKVRPTVVNLYIIAAANYRLLGDDATAVKFYKEALQFDQRPEIYVNLANAQSHTGMRNEAVENLMRAYTFWPSNGDEIEDPFVHDEVMRRMEQYRSALKRAH